MNRLPVVVKSLLLSALSLGVADCYGVANSAGVHASSLKGSVSLMGKPVNGAAITLWQVSGGREPKQLRTLSSDKNGAFSISVHPKEGSVHYLVTKGGRVNGAASDRLAMLTVLDARGPMLPPPPEALAGVEASDQGGAAAVPPPAASPSQESS